LATHSLEPAGTPARFAARPVGRYLVGEGFAYWCASEELFGFALWGRPGRAAMEQLAAALRVELEPRTPPHRSLVDTSLLEAVDPSAFEVLQRYVKEHHAALTQKVTRLALVRPPGLVGAVVSGFYQVLDSPYPTQAFEAVGPALDWLEADAGWGAPLEALRAEVSGVAPLLSALRAVLSGLGARTDVGEAAKRLGLSQRTLQRRLAEQQTSFAVELNRQRMLVAQRLMRESDAPLTELAIDAGFASLQHFSAAFRKATGKTPTAWRKLSRERPR